MNIVLLGALASVIVLLIVAAAVLSAPPRLKSSSSVSDLAMPLAPLRYAHEERTLREREIDEAANALASEFRRVGYERWLSRVRQDAVEYFAPPSTAAAKKSP